jgi:hypothetical protein
MVRGSDQEQAPLSCAKRVPRCATTCRSWWSADGYGCCFPASHAPYRSPMTTGARVPRTKRVAVARAATCPRPAAAPMTTEARAPRLPRAVRATTCPRPAEMTRQRCPHERWPFRRFVGHRRRGPCRGPRGISGSGRRVGGRRPAWRLLWLPHVPDARFAHRAARRARGRAARECRAPPPNPTTVAPPACGRA